MPTKQKETIQDPNEASNLLQELYDLEEKAGILTSKKPNSKETRENNNAQEQVKKDDNL